MTKELRLALRLAKSAGEKALRGMNRITSIKSKSEALDFVTNWDISIERFIVRELRRHFPSYGIVREEEDNLDSGADFVWIIDPIDGTKYFIKGIKMFTVSIALWHKGQPVLGVVCHPGTGDCYYAAKGQGAFLNKKQLSVSKTRHFSGAIIALDCAKLNTLTMQNKKVVLRRLNHIYANCYRFRALGSGTLSLCWLAQGYFDAYFDLTGQEEILDVAAGIAIVKEAGGKISGLDGKWPGYNTGGLVVTNGVFHKDFLKLLSQK